MSPFEELKKQAGSVIFLMYHYANSDKVLERQYKVVHGAVGKGERIILNPKDIKHETIVVYPGSENLTLLHGDFHWQKDLGIKK